MLKIKNFLKTYFTLFKKTALISFSFLLALAVFMGIAVVYAVWQEPSVAPPDGNTSGPINVTAATQTITDSKTLNIKNDFTGKLSIKGNLNIAGTDKVVLEAQGGSIKATDGLIIQTLTSDPVNPEVGRIWLRTDL